MGQALHGAWHTISDWGLHWLPWAGVQRWPREQGCVTCEGKTRDLEGPCSLSFCLCGGRQGLGLSLRPGGKSFGESDSILD